MQAILYDTDFNDIAQWCEVDSSDRIAKDRDTHGALLPAEFKAGFLEAAGLKEDYARYIYARRDEL